MAESDPADASRVAKQVSRFERPFALRVLRLAMEGKVAADVKVLRERGPIATIYFGALVLLGMVVGGVGALVVVAVIVAAFAASGPVYDVVVAVSLVAFAIPTVWFVVRLQQFLKASKHFRQASA